MRIKELKRQLAGEVVDGKLAKYMLSTDGSIFMRQPAAVVYPKETGDVAATVNFARDNGLAVHPRGAGSGLCGSSLGDGIVIDFTRYMSRLIGIDAENRTFECQPGYRLGELNVALAGKGLFFPPDPSSGEYASFGGMFGTNASGAHSVKYGNVSDYIVDARIVLADGHVMQLHDIEGRAKDNLPGALGELHNLYLENQDLIENAYPDVNYNVAGYNLRGLVTSGRLRLGKLFAGAEGTLGVATRLKFKLLDKPEHDSLVVCFSDRIEDSARAVQNILPMGPSGIEIMDRSLLKLARETDPQLKEKIPADVDNVLLIEFDAPEKEACVNMAADARRLLAENPSTARSYTAISADEKQRFWAVRTAAVPILYRLKGARKILALTEDAVVPIDRLVDYFKGIRELFQRHGVRYVTYGHIAKGLMHTRPLLNLKDAGDVRLLKVLADEMFKMVHDLGGVVSGEHGDGRLRSAYIREQYPDIYDLFIQVKKLFDPRGVFNPEIKVSDDPFQMTRNLRFGDDYRGGDWARPLLRWEKGFADEVEKCHGCSKCTTVTTATRMCPVYKFNRIEDATPKAKANILRALVSGAVTERALFENSFQKVIKLCANCGSCRHECPSGVNIPKMAIEARAAYVRKFGPGPTARLLTGVESAARLFGRVSHTIKPVADLKVLRKAVEKVTGVAAEMNFIPFASRPLSAQTEPVADGKAPAVLYFAGCYATYIRPEIGEAALAVMRKMGLQVHLPEQHCCGLPMISKGMIPAAQKKINRNLEKWQGLVGRVDHVVVTCSSCLLALTREWRDVADSAMIDKIADKTILVSSLVNRYASRFNLEGLEETVAYHSPCHLRVQKDPDSSLKMLARIPGLKTINLKSHCCGIAGTWGMTADNFKTSKKLGRHLIDLLDRSSAAWGATDCPTCRIQMEQFGDKPVYHPIEVVARCIESEKS
jgi:FAD/FMN-containing dehydrogenase/Fe-S oxidoreductase